MPRPPEIDLSATVLKFSFRERDRWNLTNSTLTLRESLRSLSAKGDHCASFRPGHVKNTGIIICCILFVRKWLVRKGLQTFKILYKKKRYQEDKNKITAGIYKVFKSFNIISIKPFVNIGQQFIFYFLTTLRFVNLQPPPPNQLPLLLTKICRSTLLTSFLSSIRMEDIN
jgi:hypothetical protein